MTTKNTHIISRDAQASSAPSTRSYCVYWASWRCAFYILLWAIIATALLPAVIIAITSWLQNGVTVPQEPPPNVVVPISCHSHNDYWRKKPLFSALETGCIGIEADVWVYENELYVAHNRASMKPGQTFMALYVNPLVLLLQHKNPQGASSLPPPRGVYDSDPAQTVVLLVDLKSDPETAWSLLLDQVEPLRQKGWLSTIKDGKMVSGPITVVATGALPPQAVEDIDGVARDIFLDAPLLVLSSNVYQTPSTYWASVSFFKSIGLSWSGGFGLEQLSEIRRQVQEAHSRDLKIRYWELPSWPIDLRNRIWKVLLDEGVDLLNVDNLSEASEAIRRWRPV